MGVQFRVNFRTAGETKIGDWFAAESLAAAMERVRSRMQVWDGPYQQKIRDGKDDFGPWRPFSDAAEQFRSVLSHSEVGDVLMMHPKSPSKAFVLARKVHVQTVAYPTISSSATPKAKAIVKPLWSKFPQLQYWGCYNCRHIAGSTRWSEHSWSDAIDVHPPSMAYGDQANRWLQANRGRYGITRTLWRVAGHYDHIHIDFDPDHTGTPPCAL